MSVNVKAGGSYRTASHVWIKSGGIWRDCSAVWVKSGGVWRQVFSGARFVQPFTAWAVRGDSVPGNQALASWSFLPDGTVSGIGSANDNTTPGSGNWHTPTSTGFGAGYYIRATATSGTVSSGTVGVWQNLGTTRTWTKFADTGSASVTLTIEIAEDSGGTNVVFTSTGNTLAYTHS